MCHGLFAWEGEGCFSICAFARRHSQRVCESLATWHHQLLIGEWERSARDEVVLTGNAVRWHIIFGFSRRAMMMMTKSLGVSSALISARNAAAILSSWRFVVLLFHRHLVLSFSIRPIRQLLPVDPELRSVFFLQRWSTVIVAIRCRDGMSIAIDGATCMVPCSNQWWKRTCEGQ